MKIESSKRVEEVGHARATSTRLKSGHVGGVHTVLPFNVIGELLEDCGHIATGAILSRLGCKRWSGRPSNPQILAPRPHRPRVLPTHDPSNLNQVIQIVHQPRGEMLA